VHADADVHDTAFRELNCSPEGLGVAWICHTLPFQCSARVPAFDPPTAVQDEADVHDTLAKLPPPCEGLGVAWISHALPFHCSARVPAFDPPTAVQDEADVQDTLDSEPPPGGLGVAWICHALPFHRSANVPALELPTAVQAEDDVHATLLKRPPPDEGLGVGWIRHRLPFRRSARSAEAPELVTAWPTAVHAEGEEQDTLNSALSLAPRGLGVDWIAQSPSSRCSARVTTAPEPLVKSPTAVQEDGPEQEIPTSWPVRADRFWVGTIDHPDPGLVADGDDKTLRLVAVAAALPRADAANAVTARNPNGTSLARNRDPENRLRAEFMSTPRIRCFVCPPKSSGLTVRIGGPGVCSSVERVPWLTGCGLGGPRVC
jgi:hypothetical protein